MPWRARRTHPSPTLVAAYQAYQARPETTRNQAGAHRGLHRRRLCQSLDECLAALSATQPPPSRRLHRRPHAAASRLLGGGRLHRPRLLKKHRRRRSSPRRRPAPPPAPEPRPRHAPPAEAVQPAVPDATTDLTAAVAGCCRYQAAADIAAAATPRARKGRSPRPQVTIAALCQSRWLAPIPDSDSHRCSSA